MHRFAMALLFLPLASAQPLLVAVVAEVPGGVGEGIAVASDVPWDMTGHALTDGEAVWRFPNETLAGEAWIVADADHWLAHGGPPPRWGWPDLRLGNGGDQMVLVGPDGDVIDAFAFGNAATPHMTASVEATGAGMMYRRENVEGWIDTDHARDWIGPEPHRIGRSDLDRPTWQVAVTGYGLPDAGSAVLGGLMDGAQSRLDLHVYDLQAPHLVDGLVAACQRGVDVHVLVEGAPVGTDRHDRVMRAEAARRLEDAGCPIVAADDGRYRYHHLKVLVADDALAVQSENWVAAGVPESPTWGHRGWGAVLHGREPADWFASWMAADRAAWDVDVLDWRAMSPWHEPPPTFPMSTGGHTPMPAATFHNVTVRPIISPDHTADGRVIQALLDGAEHRVLVQQLDLSLWAANSLGWSAPDVLTHGLAAAASRGVHVQAMAAAPFRPDDTGNTEALDWLRGAGVQGRIWDHPSLDIVHNKGLIVDDAVLLGSMNGNHHSRSNNREASVLIDDARVADYYAGLFADDWDAQPPRDWGVIADDLRMVPMTPVPILLALALVVRLRRC